MRELVKKLRKYEIQIRKAITAQMQGNYHSIFKGSGLESDDIRTYQYGDDIRTIDWNVTAKGNGTYVKTYKEEKEQTIFFLLDVSASQEIGSQGQKKIDIGKEICGVLTLSAIKENSHVGLICYSDQKEQYVRPGTGTSHGYQLIKKLYELKPVSIKTNLSRAILYALNAIKRRSVVILISDFIDEGYEHNLKALARKHDLVVIKISDNREINLPKLGIIPLYEKESQKTIWINTSSKNFRSTMQQHLQEGQFDLHTFCKKNQANYLSLNTKEDFVPQLIKLFKLRNKTRKSV
jgi:uncharacterized protein (DUF58 family)